MSRARRESEPTQTVGGPESLDSRSPMSALSAAERSAGDLERASEYGWSSLGGAQENIWLQAVVWGIAEPAGEWKQQRERKKAASSILAIFPSQEHVDKSVRLSGFQRAKCASFHKRKNHPYTKWPNVCDRLRYSSKPPPKCTKCCSICCKRKLTTSSVSSLGDSSISPIQKRSSIVYRKIPKISPTKYKPPKPVTQKPSVKSPLQI